MTSSTTNNEKNEKNSCANGNENQNNSNDHSNSNGSNDSINLNLNPMNGSEEPTLTSGSHFFELPLIFILIQKIVYRKSSLSTPAARHFF